MAIPNYRRIAVEVGDQLKYSTSVNEIGRIASAIFRFPKEEFPNESITSVRAKEIYNWILSLAKQELSENQRNELLISFCTGISGDQKEQVLKILTDEGIYNERTIDFHLFMSREFHPEIIKHSRELFLQRNYFHAVFESCKAYNIQVKEKTGSTDDGETLMMKMWGWEKGYLKVTKCETETDKNIQEGIKYLSSGLMRAVRNPTAHEPALDWPISKQDCLDMLHLISFLFRQLDKAVVVKP